MGNNKYSCDNAVTVSRNFNQNKFGKLAITKCLNECKGSFIGPMSQEEGPPSTKCIECVNNNGFDDVFCVEGNGRNILLIVIASITGLLFLFKLVCMFAPKTSLANAF